MLRFVLTLVAALVLGAGSALAAGETVEVWKSPTCGCCGAWVKHLQASGFTVKANNTEPALLRQIKRQAGIGKDLASCHTGKIGGYIVEGHVPAADVKRLLAEKPDAIGLTVPGMPIGSPGMEGPDPEPYDVLLIKRDGTTEVFAHHG
ncbi:DUF411 domain-containing protein [Methyloligella sp. 2.7D]|uniref:DUF411 domain-containing protein n=1 Tax=unclassified Methyloligella TaxID=2625955 RepID=UPI00157CFA39|nr:DUF411 domain-containing protein [Methyloligella sp. GL2]QKP76788.1 DUF411 domain-containing protein [Methyloligella sp. GL2]